MKNKVINNLVPGVSPLPPLSPSLNSVYQSLNVLNQRLFIKVFRWLYDYLLNKQTYLRRGGVLFYWWAVDMVRVRSHLTTSDLAVLTYLYQMTEQGQKIINSKILYNGYLLPDLCPTSLWPLINRLMHRGYIVRYNRNHQDPYMQRSIHRSKVFINLTPAGVSLIKSMENDLYNIMMRSSLNDITGQTIKNP